MYTISEFDNSSNNNTTTNTTTIMDNPEVGINDLFKDAKEAWDRYQKQQEEKASSSASSNVQPPQQQPLCGSMLNPLGDAQAQPYAAALAASSINNPVAAASAAAGAASRRSGDAPSQKRVSESSASASASNGQEPQAKSESKAPPPPPPPPRPLTKEEQANSILTMLLGKNNNSPTPDPPFPTSLTDSDNISQDERRRREGIEESIKLKYYQTMNPTRELVWDEPTFTLDKDAKTSSSSSKKRKSPQPTYSFKGIANVYNQTHCGRAVIYTTCRSALPRPSSDSNYYESAGMVDGLLVSSPKKLKPSLSTTKNDKDWTKEEADTMMDFANQYTQKKKKKKQKKKTTTT